MRHPLSPFTLVIGLVLAAIGGIWLLRENDLVDTEQLAVAGPVVLIVVGVLGIALTLRRRS